jgi:hypothetical protein
MPENKQLLIREIDFHWQKIYTESKIEKKHKIIY